MSPPSSSAGEAALPAEEEVFSFGLTTDVIWLPPGLDSVGGGIVSGGGCL